MSNEEFADLQAIADRAKERLGLRPQRQPRRLDAAGLVGSLPVAESDAGADERERRVAEALEVRGMLPPFLRTGSGDALGARVTIKDFVAAALGWRWGDGNLLLLGPTGSGKSTAVAMLFRSLLVHGVKHGGEAWESARFMAWYSAADLFHSSREHALGKGEAPELRQAGRARLLVIDDAGWDSDPRVVSGVLAERYESGLPTIVTSGKTELELVAHYGAAVVRRMTEAGGGRPGGGIMARFPTGTGK